MRPCRLSWRSVKQALVWREEAAMSPSAAALQEPDSQVVVEALIGRARAAMAAFASADQELVEVQVFPVSKWWVQWHGFPL